jgi:hypothetical protein
LIGKFRIQFMPYNGRSAEENCLSCMNVLRQYFQICEMKTTQPFDMSINESSLSSSNDSNAKFEFLTQQKLTQDSQSKDVYTHKEMAQVSYANKITRYV